MRKYTESMAERPSGYYWVRLTLGGAKTIPVMARWDTHGWDYKSKLNGDQVEPLFGPIPSPEELEALLKEKR